MRVLGRTDLLRVGLLSTKAGRIESNGSSKVVVLVHVGPAVDVWCKRGGQTHHGRAIHGDIDVIPAGTPSVWEVEEPDTTLIIALKMDPLRELAANYGRNRANLVLRNRFQARDLQIEHLAWALLEEAERGNPGGAVFLDGIATALAARLVREHSCFAFEAHQPKGRMAPRKLRAVLAHIEEHLSHEISLQDVAEIAGLSVSHFKVLFRRSVGIPAHRYLIQRRVERAASLLRSTTMAIDHVAAEAGFAHQSHLAMHMRRILGQSPAELRNSA
jgi:AraC family transcriptional regulator